ncbi:hypothetical protein R1flu_028014 [Riccia fluitans]|uniref:Secreted protein n=1 Tax=Riccia fluitans TaxID=41844 RepID=A0ABD1XKI0_9MARC
MLHSRFTAAATLRHLLAAIVVNSLHVDSIGRTITNYYWCADTIYIKTVDCQGYGVGTLSTSRLSTANFKLLSGRPLLAVRISPINDSNR